MYLDDLIYLTLKVDYFIPIVKMAFIPLGDIARYRMRQRYKWTQLPPAMSASSNVKLLNHSQYASDTPALLDLECCSLGLSPEHPLRPGGSWSHCRNCTFV